MPNNAFEADRGSSWPRRARNGLRARRCGSGSCVAAQLDVRRQKRGASSTHQLWAPSYGRTLFSPIVGSVLIANDEGRPAPIRFTAGNPQWSLVMKKFLVLYLAPASTMEDWKKTDPATRKTAEEKMQREWKTWMGDHASMFVDAGAGVGKTKLVAAKGISDTTNEVMLYAVMEADTHEAAANMFEGHPHLQIPKATIEVMEIHPLPGK
jgi:hypothetical protein